MRLGEDHLNQQQQQRRNPRRSTRDSGYDPDAMCRQLQDDHNHQPVSSSGLKRPHPKVRANKKKSPKRSQSTCQEDTIPESPSTLPTPPILPLHSDDNHLLVLPRQDSDADDICGTTTDRLIPELGPDLTLDCLARCSRSDFGTLSLINSSFRSLISTGEIYKARRRRGVVEHWVYFSCHGLEWDAFDPHTSRYMHLLRIPQDDCFMCSDKESLAVGTDLLVFRKIVHSHVVLRYSLLTNSWSPGKQMNTPRCLFASASFAQLAIVAGGYSSTGTVYASAEMYDSDNHLWNTLPDMNQPRKMCSGFFMDGTFYIIGGMGNNGPFTCGEVFHLGTKKWTVIPHMFPTAIFARTPGVNNQLYAADYSTKVLHRYQKPNNTWVALGPLPERSSGTTNGWGVAFKACGDSLVVIGGPRTMFSSCLPTADGSPPQWELIGRKPSGCFVYNCAVMGC